MRSLVLIIIIVALLSYAKIIDINKVLNMEYFNEAKHFITQVLPQKIVEGSKKLEEILKNLHNNTKKAS